MQCEITINGWQLPYSIRKSSRARHVNLKVSSGKGLEIVVPTRFNLNRVEGVLHKRREWILRHADQIMAANAPRQLPDEINLRALEEVVRVEYDTSLPRWGNRSWSVEADDLLVIYAQKTSTDACVAALQAWLRHYAQEVLGAWLSDVSIEVDLPFNEVNIRNQATRWGSCSRAKNISLNQKLLFLPEEWVHYILVHELCHTRYLNHSSSFWKLVQHHLPQARMLDKTMRKDAMAMVPWWVE